MGRGTELRSALVSDEQLRNRLSGAGNAEEGKKVLADAGFGDVTKEDLQEAKSGGELSDSELSQAAGAGSTGAQIGSAIEDAATSVVDEIGSWFDW